jgi:peptidoglycan/LPS O-acetylase OafA/YrhL
MTKATPALTNSDEISCISYWRGLAALGVVLHHVRIDLWVGFNSLHDHSLPASTFDHFVAWLSLPTIFTGSGVMLFFVISGFCIHYPYAGLHGKKLDLAEYGVRRFFRIYPPYLAAVLFTFAVQWIGYREGFLPSLDGSNYRLSALLLQNSFGNQPDCNPALWTIPIEVAFYLFFPLVYAGLRRSWLSTLGAGLTISLLAITSSLLYPIQSSFLPYWFTWMAGAALAEQYKKGLLKTPPLWISCLGILFFLSGLICAWHVRAGANDGETGRYGDLIELIGSFSNGIAFSVLIWWSISQPRVFAHLPSSVHQVLLSLGAVSYSLYLFHMPLFKLCGWLWTSHFGGKPVNYLMTFPFVFLAIVVAGITYQVIEAPAHLAGRKLASRLKRRSNAD